MNKNDKFHGGITPPECENNVNELSDDELDSVAGGADYWDETGGLAYGGRKCKSCRSFLSYSIIDKVGYTKIVQCSNCLTSYKITRCEGGVSFEFAY